MLVHTKFSSRCLFWDVKNKILSCLEKWQWFLNKDKLCRIDKILKGDIRNLHLLDASYV